MSVIMSIVLPRDLARQPPLGLLRGLHDYLISYPPCAAELKGLYGHIWKSALTFEFLLISQKISLVHFGFS